MLPLGMLFAASGMWVFTGTSLHSTYVSHVLPANMLVGAASISPKYEPAIALMEQTIDATVATVEQALLIEDPWLGLVHFLESSMQAQDRRPIFAQVTTISP